MNAINLAIKDNVDIINISLGVGSNNPRLETVVKRAYEQGIFVIASSGNNALLAADYPARYKYSFSVSAIDKHNNFFNYSAKKGVDIVSEGVDIEALDNQGNKVFVTGTSFATATATRDIIELIYSNKVTTPPDLEKYLVELDNSNFKQINKEI
ncbi:S8 family serine peptidase [Shouchella miscanthi]|uniref:S8 family serine peptidase n=1 Tax=Shouchella miscanthi TaxID=2598861 RepID=UPI002E1EAA54|nr:S8 family serine peptidase [Shouchella miscanthi]